MKLKVFKYIFFIENTPQYWEAYREVNALFAEEIVRFCKKYDYSNKRSPMIWCDDYQLITLPYELRKYELLSDDREDVPILIEEKEILEKSGEIITGKGFSHHHRLSVDGTDFVIPQSFRIDSTIDEVNSDEEFSSEETRRPSYESINIKKFHPLIIHYINTSWPTYEILRCLPSRHRILRGLLAADLVGFHSYIHARHFIAGCVRLLGLQSGTSMDGNLTITFQSREIVVTQTHSGMDTHRVQQVMELQEVKDKTKILQKQIGDKLAILAIEDLSRNTGIPLLLQGFEYFLQQTSKMSNRICLYLVVYRPRSTKVRPQIQQFSVLEVENICKRINNKFPNSVHLIMSTGSFITLKDRISYYLSCDILIDCAIREGLNLRHMEYIYCRKKDPGVVILSEYSTSCSFLNGVLRINPWNYKDVFEKLNEAILMSKEDKQIKHQRDYNAILAKTLSDWSVQVIKDLKRCKAIKSDDTENLPPELSIPKLPVYIIFNFIV